MLPNIPIVQLIFHLFWFFSEEGVGHSVLSHNFFLYLNPSCKPNQSYQVYNCIAKSHNHHHDQEEEEKELFYRRVLRKDDIIYAGIFVLFELQGKVKTLGVEFVSLITTIDTIWESYMAYISRVTIYTALWGVTRR